MSESDPSKIHGVDPSLYLGATSKVDALTEFQNRFAELDSTIAQALADAGPDAVEAYGSVRLYHNTLERFVPNILHEGLVPDSEAAVPDEEDIAFAENLFRAKGRFDPNSARQFDRYIKGVPGGRQPGVFLYAKKAGDGSFNTGYGRPERLLIMAQEMGCVAGNDRYSDSEREQAHELFQKYSAAANGTGEHIAVLRANPFNSNVFNSRLGNLPNIGPEARDQLPFILSIQGIREFEGVYVNGSVAPKDLELLDVQLPNDLTPVDQIVDPAKSRFY